jgi:hypothetical protein
MTAGRPLRYHLNIQCPPYDAELRYGAQIKIHLPNRAAAAEITQRKANIMQTRDISKEGAGSYARSGAIAGALSTFVFAVIHYIFISDIWYSLIMMMIAGALCGLCIGWSYALLNKIPTLGNWWRYNMLYVALFTVLERKRLLRGTRPPFTTNKLAGRI